MTHDKQQQTNINDGQRKTMNDEEQKTTKKQMTNNEKQ